MKKALSIAGVDPSGGAGIIADLKVFIAHNVYAMGVVTAVTAQNTKGLYGFESVSTNLIKKQIEAIFDDVDVDIIKIGMTSSVEIIEIIANTLKDIKNLPKVVLDPVMSCKNGDILLESSSKFALLKELFPLAYIITPNLYEAQEILGKKLSTIDDFKNACKELLSYGCKNVYFKAGNVNGVSLDIFYDGLNFEFFEAKRLDTTSTHGTGCSLSSAIAANLANDQDLKTAVKNAKEYVFNGIKNSFHVGNGCNPIHHFYEFNKS